MSKPSVGTYTIYSRVLSPSGDKLYMTWNQSDNTVNLEAPTGADNQKWSIKDYNSNTQTISPSTASDGQIDYGNGGLSVRPSNDYTFTFRSSSTGYIIADGSGNTNFWKVADAVVYIRATYGTPSDDLRQRWILEKQ
ncbi:hypothetical protein M422DRAFT_189422 [Sphaerobolus stellatus SS14]|uniref:CCL2-like lectin domain-containing protein n=1 Tax=Sphaerobolus stellatus (strain SS14) TaxID=990650 RepID=A0A0C9UIC0_SPHS4|nr:hypothetical protein M422DRAFT_189422 [Sphaerobolus stellatus SS14]